MGGLTAFLGGIREVYGLRERGEDPGSMVETSGSREKDNGHVRRYFGGGK